MCEPLRSARVCVCVVGVSRAVMLQDDFRG